jgi:hypothetical protein
MRYQVFILIFLTMIISLSAMNCEYITRFSESNTSMKLNNMIIDNGKLYLCKEYGVDLFEIEDSGELTLLNTIHADDVNKFTINNNYLFFACRPFEGDWDTTVYKYDVSNPMQPIETGQMELDYPPYTMYIWHEMLTIVDFILTRQLLYYDPETLEYIDSEEGDFVKPFYEEYWCSDDPDILTIYDLSNPFNAEIVTSVDLEPVYNGSPHVCRRISDNLYVVYSQLEMSLWDTSDFSNWQLLSQFPFPDLDNLFYGLNIEIYDNTIVFPLLEELLVVDISDPEFPQVSQVLDHNLFNPTNCLKYGEKLYLVDHYVGIQIFDITDNGIEAGEVCTEFPRISKGLVKDNYVIRETWAKSTAIPDMNIWDISSPDHPVLVDEPSLGEFRVSYNIAGNILIMKNRENLYVELYDISNLPEINYISHIDYYNSEYELMSGSIKVFDDDINSLYLSKPTGLITCYDISDPENYQPVFEIDEEDYFIMNKLGDYLYLCESSSGSERDLKIYNGIESNIPQLAAHYQNFFPDYFYSEILDDKLFISHSYDAYTTQVYYLNGVEMPELACNLYSDCSGRVYSYNGEYLVCSEYEIKAFHIPENPPEYIEPSCTIGRFSFINDVEIIQTESEDFLYVFDQVYTEVYQVESTENDGNLVTETIKMITYPNPYSFDNGQDITFYSPNALTRYAKDALLSVYNIKGQLIRQQNLNNSISWDCRLDNGIKAPSGVYLYKVNAGEGSSAGKFIITK